jgi:flagellar motor component MotA
MTTITDISIRLFKRHGMDLGSVIGLVLTIVLLLSAMVMGVGIGPYIDIPSILIVVGGDYWYSFNRF